LAQNTAIVTGLTGRGPNAASEPQNLGEIAYFGITPNADEEATAAFARYWFEEGYLTWLGVEPERKVPMRHGTQQDPNGYISAWFDLPFGSGGETISDLFG